MLIFAFPVYSPSFPQILSRAMAIAGSFGPCITLFHYYMHCLTTKIHNYSDGSFDSTLTSTVTLYVMLDLKPLPIPECCCLRSLILSFFFHSESACIYSWVCSPLPPPASPSTPTPRPPVAGPVPGSAAVSCTVSVGVCVCVCVCMYTVSYTHLTLPTRRTV